MIAHPDHMGCELVDEFGKLAGVCEKIAARDVDIGLERESDRLAFLRSVKRTFEGDDLLEPRGSTRTCHHHCLARRDRAGNYCAREAAKVAIRAVDPLHWKTEWPFTVVTRNIDKIEVIEECRTLIPRHPSRRTSNIVTKPRRQRDGLDRRIPKPRCEGRKARRDFLEGGLLESDEIHLVDGEHDVTDAEQPTDKGVPPGLRQHTFTRIDQDDGEFGSGGSGRHIPRVLLVARCVRNDKGALTSGKKPIGDVDRNPLLPLVLEPIQQQREVEVVTGGAKPPRLALQYPELVVENQSTLVEQPADQR